MVDVYVRESITITVTPPVGPARVLETLGKPGTPGLDGIDGWSPVLAILSDGARRVLQLIDWTGGEGSKPANTIGKYVGVTGLVTLIADAIDVRGSAGADGAQGPQGDPGAVIIGEGAEVLTGDGPPDNGLGVDNQLYLDNLASTIYKKLSGVWVLQTSLKGQTGDTGPQGIQGDDGPQGPAGTAGADGAQGIQGEQGDAGPTGAAGADGATIHTLVGNPTSGLGSVGDLALNFTSYELFEKTGPTTWTSRGIIAGEDGIVGADGSTIRFGTTVPSDLLGNDNDLYLRTTTGDLYTKSGGTWTLAINLVGPQGAQGNTGSTGATGAAGADGLSVLFGSGAPSSGLGQDGEVYFDTTADHYYTKSAGAWTDQGSLVGAAGSNGTNGTNGTDGTDGSNFLSGTAVPTTEGVDGDTYLRTTTGDLYGPKAGGSWGSIVGNLKGATGAAGATGAQGLTGPVGGFSWNFDDSTTSSVGIGTTDFRINDGGAITSASHVYVHQNANNASLLNTLLVQMLTNTSTVKGWLIFQQTDQANNNYAAFPVTAASDGTTFVDFTVQTANIASNITMFVNNTSYSMSIMVTGNKGDTGATGSAGSNGSNGSNGADGVRGSRWTSGSGAPGTISGQLDNDFYLNTATSDVYQLVSGVWGIVVNIKGEQGDPGSSGSGGGGSLSQAFPYNFDDVTTDSDPGSGNFRWNVSSLVSAPDLIMYIDVLDSGAVDRTSALDALVPSTTRRTTLVRIYQNTTSQETVVGKLMSVTTASGYRKLGIKVLTLRDVVPADATAYTIQFESYGAAAPVGLSSRTEISSDTRQRGVPGFIPFKNKAKNLTANRAQCVLFNISVPIFVRSFSSIVTSAVSTGGDRRILIYNVSDQRADGYIGGSLVFDSGLQAGHWASTGTRTITPTAFPLPPGQYLLIDAVGAFTGTLTVTALNGAFMDGGGINIVSNLWTTVTDMYIGSDLTGTPANPFAGGAGIGATYTNTNLPTTAGADQFDLCTIIGYNNNA
jgi:hypothetical protein